MGVHILCFPIEEYPRRSCVLDASFSSGNTLFGVIQVMAQALKVEVTPVNVRDADEIERVLAAFARAGWWPDRDGEWRRVQI